MQSGTTYIGEAQKRASKTLITGQNVEQHLTCGDRRSQESGDDGQAVADGEVTKGEDTIAGLQQQVEWTQRTHHQRDALHDAKRARRLPGDQLDGEGPGQNQNQNPNVAGGGEQKERG